MKVRFKFSKEGAVRFLGHLDTMRYFQKAIRRAGFPVAFSAGFSPHMLLTFAAPLGVGIESSAEYFDLELTSPLPGEELVRRLDEQMAEGFRVLNAVQVPDRKSGNAMSLVAAADYALYDRKGCPLAQILPRVDAFMAQDSILITKTGKSGERQVDIRPFIYEMRADNTCARPVLFLRLASASANYTRPDQVLDAFAAFTGEPIEPYSLLVRRLEVYAQAKDGFIPLDGLGSPIGSGGGE